MSEKTKVLTPPGELIDVNGRNVHVLRSGSGSPTVIFESGIVGNVFEFYKVQPEIAKITSTISYDRAGHGYSDPSQNSNRISSVIVKEFYDLLIALEIKEPVILVGWSAGAVFARYFASRFPEFVSGIVLIDSTVENYFNLFPDDISEIDRQSWNDIDALLDRLSKMSKEEILDFGEVNPSWKNRHPESHKYYRDLTSPDQIKYFIQLRSLWHDEFLIGGSSIPSLGDIPLNVIYALVEEDPNYSEEQIKQSNKIWTDVQKELSHLSTNHKLYEVKCGHDIANEKPEVVIDAILDVVEQVRSA